MQDKGPWLRAFSAAFVAWGALLFARRYPDGVFHWCIVAVLILVLAIQAGSSSAKEDSDSEKS